MKRKLLFALLALTAASCAAIGFTACGEQGEREDPHTHTLTLHAATSATCTTAGNTAYYTCNGCDEWFSDSNGATAIADHTSVTVAKLGHNYATTFTVDKEATCSAVGSKSKHCTRCDSTTEVTSIDKIAHTEATDAAVPATCTATGLTEGKHCSVCSETLVAQQEVPALGHKEETDAAVPATCTATGLTEGKHCSVCNETLVAQQQTPMIAHTITPHAAVPATCTTNGNSAYYTCGSCQKWFSDEAGTTEIADHATVTLTALGHDYATTFTVDKAATCLLEGSQSKHCSRCDSTTEVTPIAKLAHDLTPHAAVPATCTVEGNSAYYVCGSCQKWFSDEAGVTEISDHATVTLTALGHDYATTFTVDKEATCLLEGSQSKHCSRCDSVTEVTPIAKLAHDLTPYAAVPATCIADGNSAYYVCGSCQKWFSDEACTTEITDHTSVVIASSGQHDWDTGTTTKEATCTEDGSITYTCKNDGSHTKTETISAQGHDYDDEGVCKNCKTVDTTPTEGLIFKLSSDRTYYTVTGISGASAKTRIYVPETYNDLPVKYIESGVFNECVNLVSITLPFVGGSIKTRLDSYQFPFGYVFGTSYQKASKATTQNYCDKNYVTKVNKTFYIPSTLKNATITGGNILYGAFYNCSGLTSITLGKGVTTIIGDAFYGCSGQTNFYYTGGVEGWCGIDFKSSSSNPSTFAKNVYINNEIITDLVIPDTVTSISDYAFYKFDDLTKVTLSNSVTSIGEYTFSDCSNLTSVSLVDGLTSIGRYAFLGCSKLTNVKIPESVSSVGREAFGDCDAINFTEYDNAYYLGNDSNIYYALIKAKSKDITSCEINTKTKVLSEQAFYRCSNITSITIPDSVITIGTSTFAYCVGLATITVPDNVINIELSAFDSCSGLTSVTIGNSVTSIGDFAFYNCSSLTSVTFKTTNGWWVSQSSTATSGTSISSSDLSNISTAATYLTSTYYIYYWKRS
jgi:hypothetical protein